MKAFVLSVGAALAIAIVAAVILTSTDQSSQAVFQSSHNTTRL